MSGRRLNVFYIIISSHEHFLDNELTIPHDILLKLVNRCEQLTKRRKR
jgi:hypothetical protein